MTREVVKEIDFLTTSFIIWNQYHERRPFYVLHEWEKLYESNVGVNIEIRGWRHMLELEVEVCIRS